MVTCNTLNRYSIKFSTKSMKYPQYILIRFVLGALRIFPLTIICLKHNEQCLLTTFEYKVRPIVKFRASKMYNFMKWQNIWTYSLHDSVINCNKYEIEAKNNGKTYDTADKNSISLKILSNVFNSMHFKIRFHIYDYKSLIKEHRFSLQLPVFQALPINTIRNLRNSQSNAKILGTES